MEKIVNKKTNIFNENKSDNKIAKITFMLCSLLCFMNIQSSFAQNSNKLVVPVKCSGNSNQKYDECAKTCENVSSKSVDYQSSPTGCGGGDGNFPCYSSGTAYYNKNPFGVSFSEMPPRASKERVISACKASCEILKNQCSSYTVEIDTVKFLEAMPEIGISRVDPNLIEY